MSDDQVSDAGSQDDAVDQTNETTQQEPQQTHSTKPAGYYPVDLSVVPEDIRKPLEERFKYMYGQIKRNERTLDEYRGVAQTQSQKIEELMNGVGNVVDHLQKERMETAEASLKQKMTAAHESGDTTAFIEANEQLTELKAKKIALAQQKPQKTQQPQYKSPNAVEVANTAVANGEISQDEFRTVDAWQSEADDGGNLLRPWAHNTSPEYGQALLEMQAVFAPTGKYAQLSFEQKLAEMDRRMGMKKSDGGQTVMRGGLTSMRKTNKITLSPKQREIALRIKPSDPKIKTDADRLEWYRKQIERTQSRKGAQ